MKVLPDHDNTSRHLEMAASLVSGEAVDVFGIEVEYEGSDGPIKTAVLCFPLLNPATGEVALLPAAVLVDEKQEVVKKLTYKDGTVDLDLHGEGCDCGTKATVTAFKVDPEVSKLLLTPPANEQQASNGPGSMGYL